MATYKLTYFNGRGRAELARLVFAAAGVKYEDVRIEHDQWPKVKTTIKVPFGQIPTLEVDGITLCQSVTIARFLARRFNLAGKTDLEQARADMIVDCIEDIANKLVAIVFGESDKDKQAEKKKKFIDEELPKLLTYLENILKENKGGDGFLVGDNLTWADIALANGVGWLGLVGADGNVATYPKLKALFERVKALPKVAEWLAKRPVTPW